MILRVLLLVALAMPVLVGCGESSGSCVASKPMANGASEGVSVQVATKSGLGANIVGTLDVNGGLYTTPVKDLGPETDLPVGTYDGVVRNDNGDLTLKVEGDTIRLSGPQGCD